MDANLQIAYERIMDAEQPEKLFGSQDIVLPAPTLLAYLNTQVEPLERATDAKQYQDPLDSEAAADAYRKLQLLRATAVERIQQHVYGMPGNGHEIPASMRKQFLIGQRRYHIGSCEVRDSGSNRFSGMLESDGHVLGAVVVSVASTTDDNLRLQHEAHILDLLHEQAVPQWKHLPIVLDRFNTNNRFGLVFRKISGFDLSEVRRHRSHARGIDQRHMVWILDRMLSCLGYVHQRGIVHGDITPEHIIVQPSTHNALLINWGSAVDRPAITGQSVTRYSPEFSAPEVRVNHRVGPWSDIYALGKVMIWLLGGDVTSGSMPQSIEPTIAALLLRMTHTDPYQRPTDAWKLHEEQNRIKDALWPRKFIHLDMT